MAIRIFLKQKTYSIANIIGLSVAVSASILITIYILDEVSYDRFNPDADRIYRIGVNETFQGQLIKYTDTGAPLAEALRRDIPEVESSVRVRGFNNHFVRYREKSFTEKRFCLADSNFFLFFNYPLVAGDKKSCLKGPNKIVITETTARRYFDYKGKGDTSPIGKLIEVGTDHRAVEIAGIAADAPHNTHLKFDMIMSLDSWDRAHNDCWACYGVHTYFRIDKASSLQVVEEQLSDYINKFILPQIAGEDHITVSQLHEKGDRVSFFVQPLTSIHLSSHFDHEFEANGDSRYVKLFGISALLIILIACINFMNLSTARAISRMKEIGIKKAIGAIRSQLVQQFMVESLMYVLLSVTFSAILVVILIHPFNSLLGTELDFEAFNSYKTIVWVTLFTLMVAIISGSYPAFYLSSFKPIEVLKGKTLKGSNQSVFRNSLVIFQFGVSMALIITTLTIYKQLKFVQSQNPGFQKENILKLSHIEGLGDNSEAFKNELLKHPGFLGASFADALPPDIASTRFVKVEGSEQLFSLFYSFVDLDHVQTMGYKMRSGRFFSKLFPSDSSAVVINESCAKIIGYNDFEEKTLVISGTTKFRVIGIIKDFNFAGLRSEIKPLVLLSSAYPGVMAIRFAPGKITEKVKLAETIWKAFAPGFPFEYSFLDADFDHLFNSEQKMSTIFWIFTFLAIFIACLGLFGLVTFASNQRTKEIAIRKIMGASVSQISFMLSKDLLRLVVVAFLIAIPMTWYGMDRWLESFAYRTDFDFVLVLIAGSAGVVIATLTVGYRCYTAAAYNPIESLKVE